MPNTSRCSRRPSSTSSDGDNTSQQVEIMEIHNRVLEMIESFKRMSAILETMERRCKEQYGADPQASMKEDRDAGTPKTSKLNAGQGSLIIGKSLLVLVVTPDHVHLRMRTNYSLVVFIGYRSYGCEGPKRKLMMTAAARRRLYNRAV
ncbi:hypothetical protein I7I51_00081 [Histoplasma capsulatum]|uniref:Uncharacterized protein n=1 Tax=Ajellomyces capsulatus TaxID=5037 RepID=A0A8A1MB35_AJECA|nr:predicted protein [Histoplasma mississippiense (nom. inval.)]EDN08464.1 predicted protein [Histoplasma mississippiense (nom. inval.)]QSS63025.1 hypothetical protein I7I51_00081 [Histoplasma capsulatum]